MDSRFYSPPVERSNDERATAVIEEIDCAALRWSRGEGVIPDRIARVRKAMDEAVAQELEIIARGLGLCVSVDRVRDMIIARMEALRGK